jgi:Flp pilus assembly pilin Flp
MYERIQLALAKAMTVKVSDLKREEGQGATEYAMVIAFVIVGLTVTLGVLGTSIQGFLTDVGGAIDALL